MKIEHNDSLEELKVMVAEVKAIPDLSSRDAKIVQIQQCVSGLIAYNVDLEALGVIFETPVELTKGNGIRLNLQKAWQKLFPESSSISDAGFVHINEQEESGLSLECSRVETALHIVAELGLEFTVRDGIVFPDTNAQFSYSVISLLSDAGKNIFVSDNPASPCLVSRQSLEKCLALCLADLVKDTSVKVLPWNKNVLVWKRKLRRLILDGYPQNVQHPSLLEVDETGEIEIGGVKYVSLRRYMAHHGRNATVMGFLLQQHHIKPAPYGVYSRISKSARSKVEVFPKDVVDGYLRRTLDADGKAYIDFPVDDANGNSVLDEEGKPLITTKVVVKLSKYLGYHGKALKRVRELIKNTGVQPVSDIIVYNSLCKPEPKLYFEDDILAIVNQHTPKD